MHTPVTLLIPLTLSGLFPFAFAGGECGSWSCPNPVNYCYTSPNSVSAGAVIAWTGSPSLAADDFHLVSTGCPANQFLVYFYGGASCR